MFFAEIWCCDNFASWLRDDVTAPQRHIATNPQWATRLLLVSDDEPHSLWMRVCISASSLSASWVLSNALTTFITSTSRRFNALLSDSVTWPLSKRLETAFCSSITRLMCFWTASFFRRSSLLCPCDLRTLTVWTRGDKRSMTRIRAAI